MVNRNLSTRYLLMVSAPRSGAGGAGQQRESPQQVHGQAEVGEGGAADPGAVQRQGAVQHLWVDASDGLEQPQVRALESFLLRDRQEDGRPRVLPLVHG